MKTIFFCIFPLKKGNIISSNKAALVAVQ